MEEINKIPPVTRFLCGATVLISPPVLLGLIAPYRILFVKELVVQKFEIWRIASSFFLTSQGIGFLFDMVMLYRNSNELETQHFARRSADYAYQLSIAALSILALNIPLNSYVHFRALLLCITYLSSRLNPAARVSLFGLVHMENQYFPFALVAMDGVMGGIEAAMQSLTGIIVGHAWWLLEYGSSGNAGGLGRAPRWLAKLFGESQNPTDRRTSRTSYGTRIVPRGQEPPATTGYRWGSGQRLGTE